MPNTEKRVKNNNFYVVSGWMINELGLSGRELQVYAIIYGFTQDGKSEFAGSLNYIAAWLGTSNKNTVLRAVDSLVDKGLISKRQERTNGVLKNIYSTVPVDPAEGSTETVPGVVPKRYRGGIKTVPRWYQNGTEGSAETVPNIYIYKDTHNYINNNKEPEKKKDDLTGQIQEYSNGCQPLADALTAYVDMRKKMKKPMTGYALKLAFNKLDRMADTADEKAAIVNQSVMNGWQGLFPVKKEEADNGRKSAEDYRGIHGLPELDTDISKYQNIKF